MGKSYVFLMGANSRSLDSAEKSRFHANFHVRQWRNIIFFLLCFSLFGLVKLISISKHEANLSRKKFCEHSCHLIQNGANVFDMVSYEGSFGNIFYLPFLSPFLHVFTQPLLTSRMRHKINSF